MLSVLYFRALQQKQYINKKEKKKEEEARSAGKAFISFQVKYFMCVLDMKVITTMAHIFVVTLPLILPELFRRREFTIH